MVKNPFGDSSDTLHAWREKYRQLEAEANSLRLTLSEVRIDQTKLTEQYQSLFQRHQMLEEELSNTKRELLTFKELARDRSNEIEMLRKKLDTNAFEKLQVENRRLLDQIEGLHAQITRGGESPSKVDDAGIFNALIPVVVHEFAQNSSKFEEAFHNLIEMMTKSGDVLSQIVAILYKYGGTGPIERVRELVDDKQNFDTAIEILVEENIIVQLKDTMSLYDSTKDLSNVSNWDSMSISELLDILVETVNSGGVESINLAFDNFRDYLSEKEIAASTILFEIRKIKEGLTGKYITRAEARKTINQWRLKLEEN